MTGSRRGITVCAVLAALSWGLFSTRLALAVTDVVEVDLSGAVAADQTAASSSEVTSTITTPQAVSFNGQSVGTLTTTVLPPEDTDSPYDLQVYTSTAAGTSALTGVVLGGSGVLAGASVTLLPSAGGAAATVTSDANGGFAFVNMPAASSGSAYTLSVTAPGYGSYTVTGQTYFPDTTYQATAALTASTQAYDGSVATQASQVTAASGSLGPYTSFRRPPPSIKVAVYQQTANCAAASSNFNVVSYPERFYVTHVAIAEIVASWPMATVRANMLAESNYAWYFQRHPPSSTYNVTNTTSFQCFKPWLSVPSRWPSWLDGVLQSHYRNNGNSDIHITQYRAGTRDCTNNRDSNILSQWGSLALIQNCGDSYYKDVDDFYYRSYGSFADSTAPPVPNTSFSRPSGGVKLTFPSQVGDANGHVSNVGWNYRIDTFVFLPSGWTWLTIYNRGWSWSSRSIPTSYTYSTSSCRKYRVRASNPIGSSSFTEFNGGGTICPA